MTKLMRGIETREHERIHQKMVQKRFAINARVVRVIVLFALLAVGSSYLVVVNEASQDGFHLKDLEKRKETLLKENRVFEMQTSKLQSLERIQEEVNSMDFVSAGKIEYIEETSSTVALGR